MDIVREVVIRELAESAEVKKVVAEQLVEPIVKASQMIIDAYRAGNKVLLIGNGGSAADAQHIASELVGRFQMERKALPAIALTTDTSTLTSLANDYGYDTIFSRQLEALASAGDVLIAITTSGASENILKAIETAHSQGVIVIALTGEKGKQLEDTTELTIRIPSANTQRIQEAHITIGHIVCHLVEEELFNE